MLITSSKSKLTLLVWSHESQQELLERAKEHSPPGMHTLQNGPWRPLQEFPCPPWEDEEFVWSACWPYNDWQLTGGQRLLCSQNSEEAPVDCQSSPAPHRPGLLVAELDCGRLVPRHLVRWLTFSAVSCRRPHESSSTLPARLPACQGPSWWEFCPIFRIPQNCSKVRFKYKCRQNSSWNQ